jgi:hypothetical protein
LDSFESTGPQRRPLALTVRHHGPASIKNGHKSAFSSLSLSPTGDVRVQQTLALVDRGAAEVVARKRALARLLVVEGGGGEEERAVENCRLEDGRGALDALADLHVLGLHLHEEPHNQQEEETEERQQ